MFTLLNTLLTWMFRSSPVSIVLTNPSKSVFEIFRDSAYGYRFRLRAANGETILSSEGYTTKANAKKGIASVKRNCSDDFNYERKTAKNGHAMFNLRAANYEVIGTSELYASTANRDRGILSVKRHAPDAMVIDLTK